MDFLDRIHPNVALVGSATIYPLLFRMITPLDASASRFMKSREFLSVSHCTFMVSSTLFELFRQYQHWVPPAWRDTSSSSLDIIAAAPPFTQSLIAIECGYLLQDFVVLIYGARRLATDGRARSVMARNVNWRILGWHHLGIAAALGTFHVRALRSNAPGSLVVLMMLLMNASTPIGTLHWYLVKFHSAWTKRICVSHGLYIITYAVTRVYLLYGIMRIFGAWTGQSALEAFRTLRWQCKLGTSVIGISNAYWLLGSIRKFARLYITGARKQ